MALPPTIQERAFQLAKELPTVARVRGALVREGYDHVDAQLSAYSFRLALKRLARANRKPEVETGQPLFPEVEGFLTDLPGDAGVQPAGSAATASASSTD